ncbi:MAG TPA: GAF domain-containing protein [Dehalococcoidia bacterium]|nr:GAF domain-containing protein [Dehalococcoidia bacterium]
MDSVILVPLVCAVIYGTLTIVTLLRFTRVRLLFALYLFTATLWSLSSTVAHLDINHQQTYFWAKMIVMTGSPMVIFYYQFIRSYTKKQVNFWTYFGYASAILIIVLSVSGILLRDANFTNGQLYMVYLPYVTLILNIVTFGYLIAVVYTLFNYYRSPIDAISKRRTMYMITGVVAFAILGLTTLHPSLDKYPLDYIGGTLNAFLITYAILRYQLLDIKVVLRKGLVYSGLTIFLSTVYLLSIYAIQLFFQDKLGSASLALVIATALVIALLFSPLRDIFQRWIDRVFYHDTYDYRQMLLDFSNKVNNVLDLNELQQTILEPIVESMHVKRAALLFPEVGTGDFKVRFVNQSNHEETFSKLKFLNDNPVITWLSDKGDVLRRNLIDIMPQFKGMWEVEKTTLDALGVQLLCPVKSHGRLIGVLALGEKQSGTSYSDEEADLLKTMSNEAAVAIENARMLDNLKIQQLQVEQLLGQVVLAQEEERNRISIELHDSVAQWLVAVSYGIQSFRHELPDKEVEKARSELSDMEGTVTKSLKELRRVVVGLRPPALDELGLIKTIRQSLDDLTADGIVSDYNQTGKSFRLPSSIEIAVYRIVQESLINIRKHANATKVALSVKYNPDELNLEIRDNGQGFNLVQTLDSAIAVGHLGLLGMKQRAEMLGGNMNIKTGEGTGTTVSVNFPVNSQMEEDSDGGN